MLGLAREHELSPDDLAAWVGEPGNRRLLSGLCVLADLQTQVLLSRYRLLAASKLIKLATEDGEGDVARRACVDLLKLDLKCEELKPSSGEEEVDGLPSRRALYAE